jgi:hypothetical protein
VTVIPVGNVCRGEFRAIDVEPGPEDFALDPDGPRGPRLLVAALRRPAGKSSGSFWSIDLTGDTAEIPQQLVETTRRVWPAGVGLATVDGKKRLYVTSQPPSGDACIEVFEIGPGGDELKPVVSLCDRKFVKTPNDVVALSNGDIYVTNLGLPRSAFLRAFAAMLPGDRGNVVKFDAKAGSWSVFADGIALANGIEVDPEERYLFVNAFGDQTIEVFEVATGEPKTSIRLRGFPDNLQWELPGAVLNVAVHASRVRLGLHFRRKTVASPSRGFRVYVKDFLADEKNVPRVEPLYDLQDFSGGSSALVFNNALYVSQVVGDQIAVIEDCDPPST